MSTEPMIGEDPVEAEAPARRGRPPLYRPTKVESPEQETTTRAKVTFSEEDSRSRAARRAAALLEDLGDDMDEGNDKFYIDQRVVPPGWSYEWKTWSVLGKENPAYQTELARRGWEAVPTSRHPEMMPTIGEYATIDRDGMRLMERPLEITRRVMDNEKRKARVQVRAKEEQLGAAIGGFDRDNKGDSLVRVKKSYEPMAVPKE